MGGLFSSQPQSTTSYSTPPLPAGIQDYINAAGRWLTSQLGTTPTYGGVLSTAPTPTETTSVQAAGGTLAAVPQATATLTGELAGTAADPTLNPIVQNEARAVTGSAQQQYQQALRAMHGSYGGYSPAAGAGGSSGAMTSDAELAGQFSTALDSALANLYQNQYNTAQGIMANAVPQALALPTQATSVGGAYTNEVQAALDRAYQNWQNQFQMTYAPASGFTSTAGLEAPVRTDTTYSQPGIVSLAQSAIPFVKWA